MTKPRKPVQSLSARRAKAAAAYRRAAIAWKKGKLCACSGMFVFRETVAGPMPGDLLCAIRDHACDDVHHIRGRSSGLLWDKEFWLPVCRKAHTWIHDHPAEARSFGLLAQPGDWGKRPKKT